MNINPDNFLYTVVEKLAQQFGLFFFFLIWN